MPAGDRTGPMGLGPMTGRGLGYFAGFATPGYMNMMPGRGWGFGRGWGRGRGWRHGYYAMGMLGPGPMGMPYANVAPSYQAPSPQQQADALKAHVEQLEQSLAQIRNRIAELEAAESKEG